MRSFCGENSTGKEMERLCGESSTGKEMERSWEFPLALHVDGKDPFGGDIDRNPRGVERPCCMKLGKASCKAAGAAGGTEEGSISHEGSISYEGSISHESKTM